MSDIPANNGIEQTNDEPRPMSPFAAHPGVRPHEVCAKDDCSTLTRHRMYELPS